MRHYFVQQIGITAVLILNYNGARRFSTSPFPTGSYPGFLSVNKIDSNSFNVYPNPTNMGYVNISSLKAAQVQSMLEYLIF